MSAQSCSRTQGLPLRITDARGGEPSPAISSLCVCWGVSRIALGELAPQGPSPLITLTLRIDTGSGATTLCLIDEKSNQTRPIELKTQGPCELRQASGLIHISSAHLRCFVRVTQGDDSGATSPELVYARTTVLEQLGIAGGRYQPMRVTINE